MKILIVASLLAYSQCQDMGWTASDYPNPRSSGYKACKMRSVASVCDPDEILTESERYRLNHDLQMLGQRTETGSGTFCQKKGIDAVLAIMHKGSQKFAEELKEKWNMDGQCQKSVIFLLSSDDRKLYYTGEKSSGISENNFLGIIASNEDTLRDGQFTFSISNIMKELGRQREAENKKDNNGPRGPADHNHSKSAGMFSTLSIIVLVFVSFFI